MTSKRRRETAISALLVAIAFAADIVFIRTPSWLIDLAVLGGLLLVGPVVALGRRVFVGPGASAPARASSWEIHPVYGIDVCKFKTLAKCKAGNDSLWTALDQWNGT